MKKNKNKIKLIETPKIIDLGDFEMNFNDSFEIYFKDHYFKRKKKINKCKIYINNKDRLF